MIPRDAVESFVNQFEEVLTEISGGASPYAFGERLFQLIKKYEKFIEGMRSRDALIEVVDSFPDDYGAVFPTVIALYKIVPAIFEQEIVHGIQDAASKKSVGAGRPPVMKSNEAKREVVMSIAQLQVKGVSLGEVHKRIAKRYGISPRTVETIWRSRKTLDTAEPRSVADLMVAFSKLGK